MTDTDITIFSRNLASYGSPRFDDPVPLANTNIRTFLVLYFYPILTIIILSFSVITSSVIHISPGKYFIVSSRNSFGLLECAVFTIKHA